MHYSIYPNFQNRPVSCLCPTTHPSLPSCSLIHYLQANVLTHANLLTQANTTTFAQCLSVEGRQDEDDLSLYSIQKYMCNISATCLQNSWSTFSDMYQIFNLVFRIVIYLEFICNRNQRLIRADWPMYSNISLCLPTNLFVLLTIEYSITYID